MCLASRVLPEQLAPLCSLADGRLLQTTTHPIPITMSLLRIFYTHVILPGEQRGRYEYVLAGHQILVRLMHAHPESYRSL